MILLLNRHPHHHGRAARRPHLTFVRWDRVKQDILERMLQSVILQQHFATAHNSTLRRYRDLGQDLGRA